MSPEDDPTWPYCDAAFCDNDGKQGWCEHVRDMFYEGSDGQKLYFGQRVCVPVVPDMGLFAEVSIDSESINTVLATMALVKDTSNFAAEEFASLGLWTMGEGRLIIAGALAAWIDAEVSSLKCQDRAHGFQEEMRVQQDMKKELEPYLKAHRWCLARHGMCFYCQLNYMGKTGPQASDPGFSMDGADYGMNLVSNPRGNGATTSRKAGAKDILRQRYGSS